MSKKNILYTPEGSEDLFISSISENGFKKVYQVHSDSKQDFLEWAETAPTRKFFYLIMDLSDGIEIDSDLFQVKEFSIPHKTVLNEFKDKVIIPEVVDLAVYKDRKETWDNIWDEYCKENPPFDNDKLSLIDWLGVWYKVPAKK